MDDHLAPRPMHVDQYVGERTMRLLKETRLYALSHAIDLVLYAMQGPQEVPVGSPGPAATFKAALVIPDAKTYIGDGGAPFFGRDGKYFDVKKMLREAQMELERLALLEVTR